MIIQLPQPFSPELVLTHLRTSSFGAPYRFVGPRRVRRLLPLGGRPAVLDFDFDRRPGCLAVTVVAGANGGAGAACTVSPALAEVATWLFALDDPLDQACAALRADPILAPLVERFAGLRILRAPDLYETLLVAILGQQVSVASAQAVRRRLMAELGDRLEADGELYLGYPAPERLLAAGPEALRAMGCSRQKARYLLALAEAAAAGGLERGALAGLSDQEAMDRLQELPGVGRWTAEVALMRGLGRPDAFPAADVGLMVALQKAAGLPHRPGEQELRERAVRWQGWRSYAALYLWMSLTEGAYA